MPYPSNGGGSVPGSLPSGVGPVGPVFPGGGSNGFPPNGPGGIPSNPSGPISPGGGSNGLPPNGPGGIPGNLPGPMPGNSPSNGPDNAPGNIPGAGSVIIPGSFPTNAPQNIPGAPGSSGSGSSDIPTCPLRSTKTVVVTVYPTDSQNESGSPWPDDSDSHDSYTPTPMPTEPSGITSLASNPGVPIFTTLTLDIWGPDGSPSSSGSGNGGDTGPSNGNSPGDGSIPGDGSTTSDGTTPGSGSGNNNGDGSGTTSGSSSGNNNGAGSNNGNDSGSNGENGSQNNPNSPFFSPAPGPNDAPQYSDNVSGGSPVGSPGATGANTLAPTPIQTPISPNGGVSGNQPQFPTTGPAQEASDSLPVTTQASPEGQGETSPWFTNVPGGNGAGQPSPSYVTITGSDGLPTVIISGGSRTSGQPQPSASPGLPQDGSNPGLPGGVSSGFPIPPPVFTGIPGSQSPSNSPSESLPRSGPDAGITTCATLTITGPNGLPTVVDSTWVVPFSTPSFEDSSQLPAPFDPQGPLSTISGELGVPTLPVPLPGSPDDGSGGSAMTTCTSFTMIGADGNPTVVHSTWTIPAATAGSDDPGDSSAAVSSGDFMTTTGLPPFGSSGLAGGNPTAPGSDNSYPITTCTSYTVVGADGLPTVVDSTFVIPGPVNTGDTISGDPEIPSGASVILPNGAVSPAPFQITNIPGLPSAVPTDSAGAGGLGSVGITTCTSYTMIGSDGLPTVVDSTWVIPASASTQSDLPGNPSFVSHSLPSGLPTGIPGPLTASAGIPSDDNQGNGLGATTCITYTTIGSDGLPTIVDTTFVIPMVTATPTGTTLTAPAGNNAGQTGSSPNPTGTFTAITTAVVLGPDGNPTPTVQTVVFSDSSALGVSAGLPQGTTSGITPSSVSGPVFTTGGMSPLSTVTPSLIGYDNGISGASMSAILTGGSAAAEGASVTGTTTGTLTWTVTSITNAPGSPVFSDGAAQPPFQSNPSDNGAPDGLTQPAYGSVATDSTLWPVSTVQTSTWTNVVKAKTTSYTFNYPLTTLATVNIPKKRLGRRQEMTAWSNSTTSSSSETSTSSVPVSEASSPSVCPAGGSVGNTTIDVSPSVPLILSFC